MRNNYSIPKGKFSTEDPLKKKREELKKKLLEQKGKVTIGSNGNINPNPDQSTTGNQIQIPPGKLAVNDEELKKKREELKKKLLEGKKVVIANNGNVNSNPDNSNTGNNIQIPPGKLASFFWYESDPELYREEIAAMQHFFSTNFQLDKLEDGRLFWYGTLNTGLLGHNDWHLQLVYDNNHPQNSSYGGSVKVYLISPEIEELESDLGITLPHILRDSAGQKYLCTAEKDNFHATQNKSTSAASCLSWAVKWISVCEMFIGGEVTYDEFANHGKF